MVKVYHHRNRVSTFEDYVKEETLATELILSKNDFETVDLNGEEVSFDIQKVS